MEEKKEVPMVTPAPPPPRLPRNYALEHYEETLRYRAQRKPWT